VVELLEIAHPGVADHAEPAPRAFSDPELVPALAVDDILFLELVDLVIELVYFSEVVAYLCLKLSYLVLLL
jgi:hypothetical protein